MSVYLNPNNALGFNRPLTTLVKRTLTITNPNGQPIAFKVKTTAPKLYCVRPNSGRVEPGESMEISVMLQALKDEPPLNAKCKDKFLIQSTILTPEKEAKNSQEIWTMPEGITEESKIHQQKLKVVYLPPEGQTLQEEDENQVNESTIVNDSQFGTVRGEPLTNGHPAPIPVFSQSSIQPSSSQAAANAADISGQEEIHHDAAEELTPAISIQPPQDPTPPVEHPPALSPTPPNDELLTKYQEAKAEIERLRTLLAAAAPPSPELHKRSRRHSLESKAPPAGSEFITEEPTIQEGVPLQVVVIIALTVFITTYLFF